MRHFSPVFLGRIASIGVWLMSLLSLLSLVACDQVGYGWQALAGHNAILSERVPIADAIADPTIPSKIRQNLHLSQRVLGFAESKGLRVGPNYRHYAPTDAQAVVYNVFATPPFSLKPKTHCFPLIGCVAYRGFYNLDAAEAYQAELIAQGLDTALFPIGAYSTLGLTADPVTTAIATRPANDLVRTLIHESVHATLYIGGDTSFDESMAEAVAEVLSFEFWATASPGGEDIAQIRRLDEVREQSSKAVSDAAVTLRAALGSVFDNPALSDTEKGREKRLLYQQFRQWQTQNRAALAPYSYGALFVPEMNNAHLLAFSLYDDLKPRLRAAFSSHFDGDVAAFLAWAASTKGQSPDQRRQALRQLGR